MAGLSGMDASARGNASETERITGEHSISAHTSEPRRPPVDRTSLATPPPPRGYASERKAVPCAGQDRTVDARGADRDAKSAAKTNAGEDGCKRFSAAFFTIFRTAGARSLEARQTALQTRSDECPADSA